MRDREEGGRRGRGGHREREGKGGREGREEGEEGRRRLSPPSLIPSLTAARRLPATTACKLTSFFTSGDQMLLARSIWQNLKLFAGEYWRKVETWVVGGPGREGVVWRRFWEGGEAW